MADSTQQPEQDNDGGDDLPSYEQLSAQKGPNSRFGRWRGWVEKRAAERYQDITPEERTRRRERGWGDGVEDPESSAMDSMSLNDVQSMSETLMAAPPDYTDPLPEPPSPVSTAQQIHSTHLLMHTFGSRFLPHSTSPIRAVLPLVGDRLVLFGHDDGLSVLDMFPSGDPETSGPADAEVRPLWEGEGVFQLDLLEFEETGGTTPQGVVLALVGSDPDCLGGREQDGMRSIRMYNLASLTSLARWAITQKDARPVDLRRPANWSPQVTPKKHRHHSSITKGLKSLIPDPPDLRPQSQLIPPKSPSPIPRRPTLQSNASRDSTWDIVDDLPLRWATDFISLASPGSRLINTPVLFFQLKRDEYRPYGGQTFLAVGTKSNIFLYETPKGERAFRFVKEFYTPLQPRGVAFVQQQRAPENPVVRSISQTGLLSSRPQDGEFRRQTMHLPNGTSRDRLSTSTISTIDTGSLLSLFVLFDKKAGLIRIADSAVGEIELYTDSPINEASSPTGSLPRLSRHSFDNRNNGKEPKAPFLQPTHADLPSGSRGRQKVLLVTRGKYTHILPSPLPVPICSWPPLKIISWLSQPADVCHRVCSPRDGSPFLQLIGLGELGLEVQEVPLTFISGKGKGRQDDIVRSQEDVGGDAGYLCRGGSWGTPYSTLMRSETVSTMATYDGTPAGRRSNGTEKGIYAWVRKGLEDWRIFWLGGSEKDLG
ncbi:hypothetical protein BD410DRAFT_779787 [Rickenella mellea]|uniref:Uncharacterized protein n=1 Tax=Rickenella mellea TaxID=50990 RepID=A0A4R5XGR4_9AGAM|nr:hypothetical protein BD410DRAFT_779787 [Rickenella mellea]